MLEENQEYVSIGSVNGWVIYIQQAITWNNGDFVHWVIFFYLCHQVSMG